MWPALDTDHHLALVADLYEEGTTGDNNALSEITVVDPDAGKVLARHPIANLINSTLNTSNFDFTSRRGLFVDPRHPYRVPGEPVGQRPGAGSPIEP